MSFCAKWNLDTNKPKMRRKSADFSEVSSLSSRVPQYLIQRPGSEHASHFPRALLSFVSTFSAPSLGSFLPYPCLHIHQALQEFWFVKPIKSFPLLYIVPGSEVGITWYSLAIGKEQSRVEHSSCSLVVRRDLSISFYLTYRCDNVQTDPESTTSWEACHETKSNQTTTSIISVTNKLSVLFKPFGVKSFTDKENHFKQYISH